MRHHHSLMTGTVLRNSLLMMRDSRPMPDSPGMTTSVSTRSKREDALERRMSHAWRPLDAAVTAGNEMKWDEMRWEDRGNELG